MPSDAVEGAFHEPRERRATLQLLVLRVVGWGCGWPAAALWHVGLVRHNEYGQETFLTEVQMMPYPGRTFLGDPNRAEIS
jgi:hypothetical protein